MKRSKLIDLLDVRKHAVKFPQAGERDEFNKLSRELGEAIIDNLTELSDSQRYEARKSWGFYAESQTFMIEITYSLAVEVENTLEQQRTRHSTVTVPFHCSPLGAQLETVIDVLNAEIKSFKKGLYEMRKLQLQRVLQTDGEAAYFAAVERTH